MRRQMRRKETQQREARERVVSGSRLPDGLVPTSAFQYAANRLHDIAQMQQQRGPLRCAFPVDRLLFVVPVLLRSRRPPSS
jgi:hypothetical protein